MTTIVQVSDKDEGRQTTEAVPRRTITLRGVTTYLEIGERGRPGDFPIQNFRFDKKKVFVSNVMRGT